MAIESVAALMSIRQRYSSMIFDGSKTVELRKVAMKRSVTHIVIYESAGTGKIVGYFEVPRVVEESPDSIWKKYRSRTGLSRRDFDNYFSGKTLAVAIEVGKVFKLKKPRSLSEFSVDRPPQSFMYFSAAHLGRLEH